MNKVVVNACHGGFNLSGKAMKFIAELKGIDLNDIDFFDLEDLPRHDEDLIAAVEELGLGASGTFANLVIETFEGNKYYIDEYDGYERVLTPETIEWVYAYE